VNRLLARFQFAGAIRGHWAFSLVAFLWGLFSIVTVIRDNFLPPTLQQKFATLVFLPKWPWYLWVIGFLLILLVMVFEGAYSAYNKKPAPVPVEKVPTPVVSSPEAQQKSPPVRGSPQQTTNLIFLGAKVARVQFSASYSEGEVFYESPDQNDPRAIIACFRNEPTSSRKVIDADYVRAQIVYRDNQEQEIGNGVASACWLDNRADAVDFHLGESHCVLLGLLQEGRLVVPAKRRKRHWDGDTISLENHTFNGVARIEVRIIGEDNDLLLAPLVLNFSITNGEPHISVRPQETV